MPLVSLTLALAVLGSDLTVTPSRSDRSPASFTRSLANLDRPSDRTNETLLRLGLESTYRRNADEVFVALEREARANPDVDIVYALAELSYVEGKRLDRRRKPEAIDRYIDAVAFAYDYLFGPELAATRQPSDPRYRLACDLYNGGLDRLLRAAQANGVLEADGEIKLKVHGKEQVFRVSLKDSPWKPEDIHQLIMASDFEVGGLPTRTYQYGVGVPLIAVRRTEAGAEGVERFYPPEMAFPLTAYLCPNSRLRDLPQGEGPRDCTLELVDPIRTRAVGDPAIPTESDLTTPLAYMWSRSDLSRYRWTGLLRPGQATGRAGLLLIRPYEPGKIPVVMVHGLASSPLAWVPMLNDLLREPRLQERCQFMLYMYPTGIPVPIAAAGLRETLQQAEQAFRLPGGSPDPAFNQMVLLGHSMGGLLSHSMAVSSGDRFWELNSDRPFRTINGPPEVLEELKRYMFFDAQPYVRRVVFLATPHRGSDLSRGVVGRVSSNLISEPDHISTLLTRLVKENPNAFPPRFRRSPTSIDTLDVDSPYLTALLSMQPSRGVAFHSIIGSIRPEGKGNTTDGVVPYRSSHLDGVESELIVRSDHGVQKDPLAIREVHRILLEHVGIGAQATAAATVRPVD
ncbi:esterase/lipase family protein [Tundrisphaera sp. TA3]|uniref:esterase/lipase family protein n=1 Tax=Tundrisphaera sp. TA3 TaxID=3435775 RepID=UPI003EC0D37A